MRAMLPIAAAAALAASLHAQSGSALLAPDKLNDLCVRSAQLMDAGGVASPDLGRAVGPIIENVKQACSLLKIKPTSGQPTYTLMLNVRAYLELSDAIPKPYPFPEAARQQLAEVRDLSSRLDAHFRALLDTKDVQLVTADRDDLAHYADDDRRLPPPRTGNPRVVFIGDSITEQWKLNEYFPERDYINRGIGGQIAAQMLGRMKADVLDLHPAAVVILAGADDLAREIPLTAIEDDYLMIADVASAAKIKVIFASVLPVSDAHKDVNPSYERTPTHPPVFIKALNEWLQSFCAQRGYTYLDYYPALLDGQAQLGGDLSDDGLNPNGKGYRVMAPLLASALSKALGPSAPPAIPPPPAVSSARSKKGKDSGK